MKQILFTTACFISIFTSAQTNSVFRDDYTNNNNKWPVKNDEVTACDVSGDNYNINMKKDGWWWMTYDYVQLNSKKPFKIIAEFVMASGSSSSEFGLTWDCSGLEDNRIFAIRKTGFHSILLNVDGKTTETVAWKKSEKKIELNKSHTLTIHFDGTKNLYYLDDLKMTETDPFTFGGQIGVGFYFHSKSNIKINYIDVLQDRGALNVVEGDFSNTKKENLGSNVNTVHTEKHPVIAHDGKTIYFIREGDERNIGEDKEKEDIWYTELTESGEWGEAKNLGAPVNNNSHNGIISIAPDNSYMIVKHVYDENGDYKEPGFSISYREKNGWTLPKKLQIDNYYNDAKYVESSMSPDGNVLIFAIERKDSNGEKDIYFSKKKPDGSFAEPINCGSVINTFADEIGPFMAADGITMYYASEGLPGYGSADIYMTRRLDDSWTNWSAPVNLGPAINTSGWDAYFSTDSKGKFAYMVSTENSIGSLDVFKIELPEKARPIPLALIKGTVYNSKTNEPMLAEITYSVIANDSLLGTIYTNPTDGKFSMVLKGGFHYSISANYAGYIGERINIDLTVLEEPIEKEVTLFLKPIEKDQSIKLNNIFFEENSSELHYLSKAELHHVYNLMKEYPKMRILIGGHAMKSDGDPKAYKKLSEDRAKEVYKFLVKMGIDKKRLEFKGFGSDKPMGDVNTGAGNAQNRSVDFTILEM